MTVVVRAGCREGLLLTSSGQMPHGTMHGTALPKNYLAWSVHCAVAEKACLTQVLCI